jgi:serine/threonine protein kinase
LDLDFAADCLFYKSPEWFNEVPSTAKVDIWAIGIIIYQLLSKGKHPFCETLDDIDFVD